VLRVAERPKPNPNEKFNDPPVRKAFICAWLGSVELIQLAVRLPETKVRDFPTLAPISDKYQLP